MTPLRRISPDEDMMMTTDRTDNSGRVELHGPPPETDYYAYYRKDWIDLCEDITSSDRTVYGVLRSLVFENRGRNIYNPVRVLSPKDLCALIPGARGKTVALGGLRDSFRRLCAVGLISDLEGNPLPISSSAKSADKALRIRIHDVPCNGYKPRWHNTEQKLNAIQAGWEANQTEPVGWEANQVGWEANQIGCETNPDTAPDQAKRDLYTSSFTPSPSTSSPTSTASATGTVVAEQEEEEGEPLPKNDTDQARSMTHRLPGAMGQLQRQQLTAQAAKLISAGWGVAALERELITDLGGVRSHFGVYRSRLRDLGGTAPIADTEVPAASAQAAARRADTEAAAAIAAAREDALFAMRAAKLADPHTPEWNRLMAWITGAPLAELQAFSDAPTLDVLADLPQAPPRRSRLADALTAVSGSISA